MMNLMEERIMSVGSPTSILLLPLVPVNWTTRIPLLRVLVIASRIDNGVFDLLSIGKELSASTTPPSH